MQKDLETFLTLNIQSHATSVQFRCLTKSVDHDITTALLAVGTVFGWSTAVDTRDPNYTIVKMKRNV